MADELGRADPERRIGQDGHVALSVAAAMAFHEVQGRSAAAIRASDDPDDALNMAASALSRLLTIYTSDDAMHARVAVKLDVLNGKFARGATEFRRSNGSVVGSMSVRRGDLTSALSLIKRVGIPFGLAIEPEAGETAAKPPAKSPEKR